MKEYELTHAAKLETLALFRSLIDQVCRDEGVADSLCYDLKLAVDEACTNVIQHGYAGMNPGSIILGLRCTPEKVAVTITDFGHAYEPASSPQPDIAAPLDDRDMGGFGLYFICQTMDEVEYEISGAGSVKCAAALGLQKALTGAGIELDMVVGCSDGSMYAAMMALGYDADAVQEMTARLWTREDLAAAQEALQLQEAIKKELAIGQQIQASFLPQTYPQVDGWEVASYFQAAREVAGDFYDLFPVANKRRLALVVADVCDKGVGAALFMALTRSLIRVSADQNYSSDLLGLLMEDDAPPIARNRRRMPVTGSNSLRETIKLVNNYIAHNHGHTNMFATVFFSLLDPSTGQLSYINGGHEPPLILDADGRIKAELAPTGPAVGMMPDMPFELGFAKLEPGDTLLAFTDGVTEAKNNANRLYGFDRLATAVRSPYAAASDLLAKITDDLDRFTAGAEQSDDITILVARYASEE